MDEVRCNNCEWQGKEEDLVLLQEEPQEGDVDIDFYTGCPNCKTDAYLADIKK